jgi:hypothetical protein
MDTLAHTLDNELAIMLKWTLTAEEWLFIRLLFLAKEEQHTKPLVTYFNQCAKTGMPLDVIKSLQKKKILCKDFVAEKGVDFTVDDIEFEDKFDEQYFKIANVGGKEVFDAYPHYLMLSGGKMVPIRNFSKHFRNEDDLFFTYSKMIKHSRVTHERVLESLEFAKAHNLINYTIAEYVISRKWEDHIHAMDSGEIGKFVTTFDTMSSV